MENGRKWWREKAEAERLEKERRERLWRERERQRERQQEEQRREAERQQEEQERKKIATLAAEKERERQIFEKYTVKHYTFFFLAIFCLLFALAESMVNLGVPQWVELGLILPGTILLFIALKGN